MRSNTKSKIKILMLVLVDVATVIFCAYTSYIIRYGWMTEEFFSHAIVENKCIIIDVVVAIMVFSAFGLYSTLWRYAGIEDVIKVFDAVAVTEILFVLYRTLLDIDMPRSFYIIDFLLLLITICCCRVSVRIIRGAGRKKYYSQNWRTLGITVKNSIPQLIKQKAIGGEFSNIVCILTVDSNITGKKIGNIPIESKLENIPYLVKKYGINDIVIYANYIDSEDLQHITDLCNQTPASIRIIGKDSSSTGANSNEEYLCEKTIQLNLEQYNQINKLLAEWGEEVPKIEYKDRGNNTITLAMSLSTNKEDGTQRSQERNVKLPFEAKGEYYVESLESVPDKPIYDIVKRIFDIVSSGIALIVLIIPMFIISLVIRRDTFGKAIYSQERLGKNGKPFQIYKFRTMYSMAEINGAQWSEGDEDERITPMGKVLRKFRIDELPQLWNVFKGDMSIVGPRPERKVFYDAFEEYIHGFSERLRVKQGLTGLAQIRGGYDLKPEEKILYDVEYIKNRSCIGDLSIIMQTVVTVFTQSGAK